MKSKSDCMKEALQDLGYSGHVSDMLHEYLSDHTTNSVSTVGMWNELFDGAGITGNHFNERAYKWL